jgi:hypothetical protein
VVGAPINASRNLLHMLDRTGAEQRFEMGDDLDLAWRESRGGVVSQHVNDQLPFVLDCSETLPDPLQETAADDNCIVSIFGLHLSQDSDLDGALLLFHPRSARSMELFEQAQQQMRSEDSHHQGAIAQLNRLTGPEEIARRQREALLEIRSGIEDAAGLVVSESAPGALAPGLVFEIPVDTDPMTFAVYARGEETPFLSLIEYAPPSYRFIRQCRLLKDSVAFEQLRRRALIPCGPDFTDEEVAHAVLGPTKAAEYAGVRWVAKPERALWYVEMLNEKYGSGHDAYRPVFDASTPRDPAGEEIHRSSGGRDSIVRSQLNLSKRKAVL